GALVIGIQTDIAPLLWVDGWIHERGVGKRTHDPDMVGLLGHAPEMLRKTRVLRLQFTRPARRLALLRNALAGDRIEALSAPLFCRVKGFEEFARIMAGLGRHPKAIVWIVHVETCVHQQRVVFIDNRRIKPTLKDKTLTRVPPYKGD